MDIKALIESMAPKDYVGQLDPEEKIEFTKTYPGADERLQFLAAHKALPYQNDVESFENPDFFTRIRRDALGIFTGPERALLQKQKRLLQDQFEPIQQARQKVGVALMHELASAPETVGQFPAVDQMLGFGKNGGTSLQPAPPLGADPAMAGMPLGASSAQAASMPQIAPPDNAMPQPLSDGGRFMTPDAAVTTPIPLGPQAQQFDYQGRPIQSPPQSPLVEQPVRPEPMASPMARAPQPMAQAPQELSIPQRLQAARTLTAQAAGHLVPGATGGLVPYHPEAQLLNAPQQQELSDIFAGGRPSGRVPLPAAPLMQALKGKTESKDKLSQPITDYLAAKNLQPTPENIDLARNATRTEKVDDEKSAIQFKESLQAGSQRTRDFLASKTGKLFLKDATPAQVEQAIKDSADQEVSVHARNLLNQFNLGGLDATEKEKLVGLQQVANVTERLKSEFTPAERREFVGYLTLPITRMAQIAKANPRFALFDAVLNREGVAAFDTAGKNLTANESAIIFGFLPQGKEWSPENFEAKLMEGDKYARTKIGDIVTLATTNRRDLAKKMEAGLPKGAPKQSAAERYNQLEKQGMKEADIYNQLVIEGHKVN